MRECDPARVNRNSVSILREKMRPWESWQPWVLWEHISIYIYNPKYLTPLPMPVPIFQARNDSWSVSLKSFSRNLSSELARRDRKFQCNITVRKVISDVFLSCVLSCLFQNVPLLAISGYLTSFRRDGSVIPRSRSFNILKFCVWRFFSQRFWERPCAESTFGVVFLCCA